MSKGALYRKYRPDSFAMVLGQDHIVGVIKAQISQEQLSHAYLFTGPRGTGKTSTARLLAKGINCQNWQENNDVCNKCDNCLAISRGESMDIIEIDAASNRGIDEIRKIKESVEFMPTQLQYKVYIIDEVHMLTKDAFNSLLKTLEEPPQHVIFILATTEVHKVPETILSRVQRYDFALASQLTLQSKLNVILEQEGLIVEASGLEIIYKLSGGSFRDAESILSKILHEIPNKEINTEQLRIILGLPNSTMLEKVVAAFRTNNRQELIKAIDAIESDGTDAIIFVKELINYTHELFLKALIEGDEEMADKYLLLMNKINNGYVDIKFSFKPYLATKLVLLQREPQATVIIKESETLDKPVETKVATQLPEIQESEAIEAPKIDGGKVLDFSIITEDIKRTNPRLGMLLMSCKVEVFNESELKIITNFEFNKDIMSKQSFKQVLEDSARKYYPTFKLRKYSCVVEELDIPEPTLSDNDISDESEPADLQTPHNELDSGVKINNSNKSLVESIF